MRKLLLQSVIEGGQGDTNTRGLLLFWKFSFQRELINNKFITVIIFDSIIISFMS